METQSINESEITDLIILDDISQSENITDLYYLLDDSLDNDYILNPTI